MTNKKEANDVTTSFTLPQSLFDKIKDKADKEYRTVSNLIRIIIAEHFEEK